MDGSYVLPSAHTLRSSTSSLSLDSAATSPVLVRNSSRKAEILAAVEREDLAALRAISAEFGGFEDDGLRKLVWPVLLRTSKASKGKQPEIITKDEITPLASTSAPLPETPHKDEGQVKLDVNRSFVSFPENISTQEKDKLRLELELVIVTILRRHPALHYFQGYHDIVSVCLLVFKDTESTIRAVESMSLHRIRDSMGTGLEPVLGYLKLVHRILAKADPELAKTVEYAASLPYFSLSWVLTLMSHDLTSLSTIARLFDFLLTTNPAMVSYLATAIILTKKEELSNLDEEEQEDPAILHHTLSKLPTIRNLYSPPTPPLPASRHLSRTTTIEADEDLISNDTRSILSSDSMITSSRDEDYENDFERDIDALDDSMLCDPDIFGPAFASSIHDRPTSSLNRSIIPPSSPPPLVSITIEELIEKSLELWEKYPLLASASEKEGEKVHSARDGIAADEVMGAKSCIFTWSLSVEGKLSDAQASAIALAGTDIVITTPPPPTSDELRIAKELADRREKRIRDIIRRRKIQLSVGTALSILGVAGVLLAVFGGKFAGREWRFVEWRDWLMARKWEWSF